ncbi:MAG: hypothetical protein ACRENH_09150, partial [Gemmatimonadaceae bacterium]
MSPFPFPRSASRTSCLLLALALASSVVSAQQQRPPPRRPAAQPAPKTDSTAKDTAQIKAIVPSLPMGSVFGTVYD